MMADATVTVINSHFEKLVSEAGYRVQAWTLGEAFHEGRVAENDYFALAFQPFDTWESLRTNAKRAELELASKMMRGSAKNWDAYLLMACREPLYLSEQYEQLARIEYDTQRMRKLVAWDVGQHLGRIDELVRPFVLLEQIQITARERDPLSVLADKLKRRGENSEVVDRAVVLFRERDSLEAL
jgi:hypothetical protein